MGNRSLAFSAAVALLAAPSAALGLDSPRYSFDTAPGALSKDVVPARYGLFLDVDPAQPVYTGEVLIDVRVRKTVPSIGIHARDLEASSASLVLPDGSRRPLRVTAGKGAVGWNLETDPPAPVPPGDYTLAIAFTGKVQVAGEGLYVARYDLNGKPEAMLATQLEAIDARRVFPCFDEPSFRAVFDVSVRAPGRYQVVSNMPVSRRSQAGEAVLHQFEPTPPMPTYLVAIAVGRLDALPGEVAGIPLRILTTEGRQASGQFALEATQQVIPFFTRYFGVPYALPKLDQVAVPSVRRGAMEDWGLISYAENILLFDPATSSPSTQRAVFSVVAHEIAHQWFGDLVTAASWDEIWLNEAFATWMSNKAMAAFHPEWQSELARRIVMEAVMERDAGTSTRPIRAGPVTESSVMEVFDDVTYSKGGAVLSMLEQWMGPEKFRRGLASYMRERRLSNATAGDLWHHLSKAAGKDVSPVARSWTDQDGFPIVQVRTRCSGGKTHVALRQRRFTLATEPLPPHLWKIPVRLSRGNDRRTVLLGRAEQSILLPGCPESPLLANAGGLGFYRVEYSASDLQRLAEAFPSLPPPDRVALLGDTFALAQAGRVPLASYFSLLARLPAIRDGSRANLFTMAFTSLRFLDQAMAGTVTQPGVRLAARALLAPALEDLGWTPRAGEDPEVVRLRGSLVVMLAELGDQAVVERAERLFDSDLAGTSPLPPSMRSPVFRAVGYHAALPRFERLVALLLSARGEEDRQMYATALAGNQNPDRARAVLALSLGGGLPANVAADLPALVGMFSPNGELAYGFTLENWAELSRLAGESLGGRFWLLPISAWRFNDATWARRLVEDQQSRVGPDGLSEARRVASRIELKALVRQRDAAALQQLLANWSPDR